MEVCAKPRNSRLFVCFLVYLFSVEKNIKAILRSKDDFESL